MKLVRADFRKILKYKISRKYFQLCVPFERTVTQTVGRTNRHGGGNSRFSEFCERP